MISIKKIFPAYFTVILWFIFVDHWGFAHPEKILSDIVYALAMLLFFLFIYSKKKTIALFNSTKREITSPNETPFRKVFRISSHPIRYIGFLILAGAFFLIWSSDKTIPIKLGNTIVFGLMALYAIPEVIRAKLVLSNTGIERYTALGKVSSSWDNISEIIRRRTGDDVLILKNGIFTGLWKSKVNEFEISLTNFDIDWQTREIGKIISKYAPLQFLEE